MRRGSPRPGRRSSASSKTCSAFEPRPGEPARPKRLIEAMRYATLGGGKRLRAFLTVETARALGRADDGPRRAGAAIECVHAYSLIHDDLPAMDDDDLRRGRPTTHRAFDEATAILAGDALQALAFEILADPATDPIAEARVALCAGPCASHRPRRHGRRADARHRRRAVDGAAFGRGDHAPAGDEDRRAASGSASKRERGSLAPARRRGLRSRLTGARSAPRFRSPTTFSTWKAMRRRSANAPARTPRRTKPRWLAALGLDGARRDLDRLDRRGDFRGRRGGRGRRGRRVARDRALRRDAEEAETSEAHGEAPQRRGGAFGPAPQGVLTGKRLRAQELTHRHGADQEIEIGLERRVRDPTLRASLAPRHVRGSGAGSASRGRVRLLPAPARDRSTARARRSPAGRGRLSSDRRGAPGKLRQRPRSPRRTPLSSGARPFRSALPSRRCARVSWLRMSACLENVPLVGEMLVEGALGGICQPRDFERRCLCVTLGQERFARSRENSLPPRLDGVGIGPAPAACRPAYSGTDRFHISGIRVDLVPDSTHPAGE